MIPDSWFGPLPFYLWQVALHSSLMGLIFFVWTNRMALPRGRTRRRLLALLLVLPMITAAVPGRSAVEFGERVAWFNSARMLAVPLPGGFHVWHVVLLIGALTVALTVWRELRRVRARSGTTAPAGALTRALFVVRLAQSYNPVALWAFREYRTEVDIAGDAVAASGRDPRLLAKILLETYQTTDRRDAEALGALRTRVDVLLGRGLDDNALPPATIVAAGAFMLIVLPWIV